MSAFRPEISETAVLLAALGVVVLSLFLTEAPILEGPAASFSEEIYRPR